MSFLWRLVGMGRPMDKSRLSALLATLPLLVELICDEVAAGAGAILPESACSPNILPINLLTPLKKEAAD
jgi:hypothetical protein